MHMHVSKLSTHMSFRLSKTEVNSFPILRFCMWSNLQTEHCWTFNTCPTYRTFDSPVINFFLLRKSYFRTLTWHGEVTSLFWHVVWAQHFKSHSNIWKSLEKNRESGGKNWNLSPFPKHFPNGAISILVTWTANSYTLQRHMKNKLFLRHTTVTDTSVLVKTSTFRLCSAFKICFGFCRRGSSPEVFSLLDWNVSMGFLAAFEANSNQHYTWHPIWPYKCLVLSTRQRIMG